MAFVIDVVGPSLATRSDMCVDMYMHMCIDMCMDICTYLCIWMLRHVSQASPLELRTADYFQRDRLVP